MHGPSAPHLAGSAGAVRSVPAIGYPLLAVEHLGKRDEAQLGIASDHHREGLANILPHDQPHYRCVIKPEGREGLASGFSIGSQRRIRDRQRTVTPRAQGCGSLLANEARGPSSTTRGVLLHR